MRPSLFCCSFHLSAALNRINMVRDDNFVTAVRNNLISNTGSFLGKKIDLVIFKECLSRGGSTMISNFFHISAKLSAIN